MIINEELDSVKNTLDYWKEANDVEAQSTIDTESIGDEVYVQKEDSNAWPTRYSGPISKVITLENNVNEIDKTLTQEIYNFLSYYTRYDNNSVYGNGLGVRGDYEVKTIDMEEPD